MQHLLLGGESNFQIYCADEEIEEIVPPRGNASTISSQTRSPEQDNASKVNSQDGLRHNG